MSDAKKIDAIVVRREYMSSRFTGNSLDSIVLVFQVVAGEGVEKGQVFVEKIQSNRVWSHEAEVFLLKEGHKFTVPFTKEPQKPYVFDFSNVEINLQQFAKDVTARDLSTTERDVG